jgi:DNA-binding beta-propeller fold protein YncE
MGFPGRVRAQEGPDAVYRLYVAAESEDEVSLLSFGPEGFVVEKTIPVGGRPTELEGPHGLRVSPDGAFWYVSLAHGNPFGSVHKFETGSDHWAGAAEVGMFPATLDVAGSSGLLFVPTSTSTAR